ncbi:M48 family metallopeptidase [Salidesulfovibrio brasiliensis]|uniref:M48 family metallopeptidase n=1 Tax=Salidesulfovibrio brasiliensis TaxID=221711 RepID=UPI0006D0CCA2|nr:M48 family metallopeptidase [Salidesulfovibrio brasiliensis]
MTGEYGQKHNPNVTPGSPLLGAFKVLLGAAIVAVALYFSIGIAVDYVVPVLPDRAVNWAARKVTWVRVPETARDLDAERSVQQLADRLMEANPGSPEISVLVVKRNMVNAFAFPDGTVMIFKGLLDQMKSENELAFILGHEMAHVKNRDALRRLGRTFVFGLITDAAGLGSENVFDNPAALSELAFSRTQESRADREGMDYAHSLYGHVGGCDQFFVDMTHEKDDPAWSNYFRSHPLADDRIQDLADHAESMGYQTGEVFPLILPGPEDQTI